MYVCKIERDRKIREIMKEFCNHHALYVWSGREGDREREIECKKKTEREIGEIMKEFCNHHALYVWPEREREK